MSGNDPMRETLEGFVDAFDHWWTASTYFDGTEALRQAAEQARAALAAAPPPATADVAALGCLICGIDEDHGHAADRIDAERLRARILLSWGPDAGVDPEADWGSAVADILAMLDESAAPEAPEGGVSEQFQIGQQPCAEFRPAPAGNEYAVWENRHSCYGPKGDCAGLTSFCDSCHRDHHAGGYETCPQPEQAQP